MGKQALAFLVTGVALMGCGEGSDHDAVSLVLDSAGVRVVRHTGEPVERLTVSQEPDLRLGARPDGGDALYRVRGGTLLDGGGVAVANRGSSEVLFFASDGEVVQRTGGEGQGPSEFSNILWLQEQGTGSLAVYDAGNVRSSG